MPADHNEALFPAPESATSSLLCLTPAYRRPSGGIGPGANFQSMPALKKKPSLLVIFLTVVIDLIGFGIVLPLLPRYSERFGASGVVIGLIIASFSVMQFFFAPAWGRLSDRIGRRPVLLISNAGSTLSYAMFALAALPGLSMTTSFWVLLGSRVFAGICGANISVASAYIADITPPDQRSKGMGLIGMAFGLGFILGPALGALSASLFGLAGPGWVAASLCGANFILAWFILVESRQPGSEQTGSGRPKLVQWAHTLRTPKVGLLVGLYFLATFCFAVFESTLPLLLGSPGFHPDDFKAPRALVQKLTTGADPASIRLRAQLPPEFIRQLAGAERMSEAALRQLLFAQVNAALSQKNLFDEDTRKTLAPRDEVRDLLARSRAKDGQMRLNRLLLEDAYPAEIRRQTLYFDEKRLGLLFAYCGLVSALVQGGVIGRLVKRFGEVGLIWSSLVFVAVSMAVIPYSHTLGWLLLSLGLFSAASGVNRAPTLGLISIYSPQAEQGAVLGVTQSAGTLARIFGPLIATGLYAKFPHSPYLLGGGIAVLAAGIAWRRLRGATVPK